MKILLVEDEISHALPLERYLKEQGHEVDVAGSRDKALALLAENRYDVAAVDLVLASSTGDTVAEQASTRGLGVVVMSAAIESLADFKETLELRGFFVSSALAKGFSGRMLLVALEQAHADSQKRKLAQKPFAPEDVS